MRSGRGLRGSTVISRASAPRLPTSRRRWRPRAVAISPGSSRTGLAGLARPCWPSAVTAVTTRPYGRGPRVRRGRDPPPDPGRRAVRRGCAGGCPDSEGRGGEDRAPRGRGAGLRRDRRRRAADGPRRSAIRRLPQARPPGDASVDRPDLRRAPRAGGAAVGGAGGRTPGVARSVQGVAEREPRHRDEARYRGDRAAGATAPSGSPAEPIVGRRVCSSPAAA